VAKLRASTCLDFAAVLRSTSMSSRSIYELERRMFASKMSVFEMNSQKYRKRVFQAVWR